MIVERIQQSYTSAKYYQFYSVATILEHVLDCFHTIVSDETNPYHPPLSWLTRKQLKPFDDELFLELFQECSSPSRRDDGAAASVGDNQSGSDRSLSAAVRSKLEKCNLEVRKSIVSRTKDGCSPLFMACKLGHLNIVKYLLDICKADIEQMGRYEALEDHHIHSVPPIWMAAVSGNISIVKLLIDYKADVNSLSDTGSTPLRTVCFLCKDDNESNNQQLPASRRASVEDLVEFEFSAETYGEELASGTDTYMQIVKLLVENGANVSKPNYNGGTCLINSIHNYQLVQYILDKGCDINASDNQSKTALHYAIQQGRLKVTELLLARGADPMLRSISCDDALQLSCLGGHSKIFEHLIRNYNYPTKRLSDAYRLLGSSILELNYDLTKVRELWLRALQLEGGSDSISGNRYDVNLNNGLQCDTRRSMAFGDMVEFGTESELQSMSADEFRIQSLMISERVLGEDHRETFQRLLYRGTFYINSFRPDRCIDIWIYALKLRLRYESIFHFESIFAAQAITRLFLELSNQGQEEQQIEFREVYDVLCLLVDQLPECSRQLRCKPVCHLHGEIFDLLIGIILKLLLSLHRILKNHQHKSKNGNGHGREVSLAKELVARLVKIDPRTANGSSLLHICVEPAIYEDGDAYKLMTPDRSGLSPMIELVSALIDNGLEVDLINNEGLSALQVVCLSRVRVLNKKKIVRCLIERGAHIDRRSATSQQAELIRQTLRELGVYQLQHVTLACLAARKMAECRIKFDKDSLTRSLKDSIATH